MTAQPRPKAAKNAFTISDECSTTGIAVQESVCWYQINQGANYFSEPVYSRWVGRDAERMEFRYR